MNHKEFMDMKINNMYIRMVSALWLLSLWLLAGGCTDSYLSSELKQGNGETVSLKLDLIVPGGAMPITRSMTPGQEQAINNFQVLVFEVNGAEEVFRYIAPFTKKSDYEITVTANVSQKNEPYRFVILANADQTITPKEGTPKAAVLNQYLYDNQGKWESQAIPMWGELNETFVVDRERYVSVLLHRALARVDVGLCFKEQTQENQTEEVEGLDNFKINSIRVYRTKNQGYVATSKERMTADKITQPNIPGTAKYNSNDSSNKGYDNLEDADEDPLIYQVDKTLNPEGVDCIVREIYIPESIESVDGKSMDEVPCIVIGGFYNGSTTETYYRADFAYYKDDGRVDRYMPILRNNRYVFNVKSVSNSGFKDPDQALDSFTANMTLNVAVWNSRDLNFYIKGDYFFQIDTRNVVLEARDRDDPEEEHVLVRVPYKTNINLTCGKTAIKYKWGSFGADADFKDVVVENDGTDHYVGACPNQLFGSQGGAHIRCEESYIQFGASRNVGEDGEPAVEREDILYLQIEDFQFAVHVKQKAINLDYDLLCNTIEVHGKYREGALLNYTHFITLDLKANEAIPAGEVIEVCSHVRKGIVFEYKETVKSTINKDEVITIKLQGKGTPTRDPNDGNLSDPKDPKEGVMLPIENLLITSNSVNDASCNNARIFFGYQTKRILAIGANAIYRFGYMLEPNTGSRAFVDASINFGTDPNSAVTMEQFPSNYPEGDLDEVKSGSIPLDFNSAKGNAFHIEYMSVSNRRMNGEKIKLDVLQDLLTNFKPHIILTGQAIWFQSPDIALIADFVNKGGVFLMFNEYYPFASTINAMASAIVGETLGGANEALPLADLAFTLPTGEKYEKDMVLNGPFGDLRGKNWGLDGYFLHGFSGLPTTDITVYNTRKKDTNPCFFKYSGTRTDGSGKPKAFIFNGDGGFISNNRRYIGPTFTGMIDYCPFAINSAYQPIARTNYYPNRNTHVYNSALFGNILAWAVDWAESENGIKYK